MATTSPFSMTSSPFIIHVPLFIFFIELGKLGQRCDGLRREGGGGVNDLLFAVSSHNVNSQFSECQLPG